MTTRLPIEKLKVTDRIKALIVYFEGYTPKAYDDGGGVWTIGIGHTGDVKSG